MLSRNGIRLASITFLRYVRHTPHFSLSGIPSISLHLLVLSAGCRKFAARIATARAPRAVGVACYWYRGAFAANGGGRGAAWQPINLAPLFISASKQPVRALFDSADQDSKLKMQLGSPPGPAPPLIHVPPPAPPTPGAQRPAQRALEARKGRHLQTPKVLTEGLAHTSERPQAPLPAPTAARTARTPAEHIHPGGGAGVGGVVPKIFRVSAKGRQNRCVGRGENHVGL